MTCILSHPAPAPMNESHFETWQDAWEYHAGQATDAYDALTEDQLLARVEAGGGDPYYSLWPVIGRKGTLTRSGPVLLAYLRRTDGPEELDRYHAAAALFTLLGSPDEPIPDLRARAQWTIERSGGEAGRQRALDEVERLIQERIEAK